MEDPIPLVADVLRRKLPKSAVPPGEHGLAGTVLIDIDVTVAKSEETEAEASLPWKSIVAVLAADLKDAPAAIAKAARKAATADDDVPLPQEVEAALKKVSAKLPKKPKEGPTKVTGVVEIVGFVPATLEFPHWREIKQTIAGQQRRAA